MPNVEIITIGTELLLGTTLDSNSAFIGRSLASIGLDVYAKHSVGDNEARLAEMLRRTLEDANGVITTGGLGPTVDDITKEAIANVLGLDLVLHEASLAAMAERFARMQRPMHENNRRQVMLPRGAIVLENPHGTAPGFIALRSDGRFIAAVPGVPREMKPMLIEQLLPWLRQHLSLQGGIVMQTLRIVGIAESEIDQRIEALFRNQENPKIAVLAHANRVDVKIMAKVNNLEEAQAQIEPLEQRLRSAIGPGIYGVNEETLEGQIISKLLERHETLGVAESCTGGALADAIVAQAGASAVFLGGVVAYANEVKERLLGVSHQTLVDYGAVSRQTACEMAEGARRAFGVDWALATTGVAGPGGGTPDKPVGYVWIALAGKDGSCVARSYSFPGERSDVRLRTVTAALAWLYEALSYLGGADRSSSE